MDSVIITVSIIKRHDDGVIIVSGNRMIITIKRHDDGVIISKVSSISFGSNRMIIVFDRHRFLLPSVFLN